MLDIFGLFKTKWLEISNPRGKTNPSSQSPIFTKSSLLVIKKPTDSKILVRTRLILDEERVINSGLIFWRVGVGTLKRD